MEVGVGVFNRLIRNITPQRGQICPKSGHLPVAPLTGGGQPAPFRIPVRFSGKSGLILLDQIRTLDQQRLVRRLGSVGSRSRSATGRGRTRTIGPKAITLPTNN